MKIYASHQSDIAAVAKPSNPRHNHIIGNPNVSVRVGTALRRARVKQWVAAAVLAAFCGAAHSAELVPAKPPISKPDARPPSTAQAAPQAGDHAKPSAPADEAGEDSSNAGAGLPIPRFVSLRTNPINLRTGPGVRYPVDWVYVRRNLPVEVIGEFDTWRRIRDPAGAEGWVHQSMLTGKRTAMVTGTAQSLKRVGEETAEVVATLDAGVIVNLLRCPADLGYCRVEVNGLQGWLKREQFWGVYPGETVQ